MGRRGIRSLALLIVGLTVPVFAPGPVANAASPADAQACLDDADHPVCLLKLFAGERAGDKILRDPELGPRDELLQRIGVSWQAWDAFRAEDARGRPAGFAGPSERLENSGVYASVQAIQLDRAGKSPSEALAPVLRLADKGSREQALERLIRPDLGFDRRAPVATLTSQGLALAALATAEADLPTSVTAPDDHWVADRKRMLAEAYAALGDRAAALRVLARAPSSEDYGQGYVLELTGTPEQLAEYYLAQQATPGPNSSMSRAFSMASAAEKFLKAGRLDLARRLADDALSGADPAGPDGHVVQGVLLKAASLDVLRTFMLRIDATPWVPDEDARSGAYDARLGIMLIGLKRTDPERYKVFLAENLAEARRTREPYLLRHVTEALLDDGDIDTAMSLERANGFELIWTELRNGRGMANLDRILDYSAQIDDGLGRSSPLNACVEKADEIGDDAALRLCMERTLAEADTSLWTDDLLDASERALRKGWIDLATQLMRKAARVESIVDPLIGPREGSGLEPRWFQVAKAELRAQGRL